MWRKRALSLIVIGSLNGLIGCTLPTAPQQATVISEDKCMQQVNALKRLPIEPLKPEDGFRRNQLCIAEQACGHRMEFDQPRWLDAVMQQFIDPYTQHQQAWNQVIESCQHYSALNPLRDLLCQRAMARYHIFTDLRSALAQSGCGTSADWQRLESYLRRCVQDARYSPGLSSYIQNRLIHYRNQVRQQCLVTRTDQS